MTLLLAASSMVVVIGLSVGLIIGGLVIAYLRTSITYPVLQQILLWVGIVLVVVGLILLVTPVLVWVYTQLQSIIGAG